MSEKQIAALSQASKKKQQEALNKTKNAIEYLVENHLKITVRSVAKQAGVSVSYIYKYPELVNKIKALKEQQKKKIKQGNDLPDTCSDRINKLESEKLKLIQKIEKLKAYIKSIKGKKSSLNQLQIENQQLKQELEFTRQTLEETRNFILSRGYDTQDEIELETAKKVAQEIASKNTSVTKMISKNFKNEIK